MNYAELRERFESIESRVRIVEMNQRVIARVILNRHYGRTQMSEGEWLALDTLVRQGHASHCQCELCKTIEVETIAGILRAE